MKQKPSFNEESKLWKSGYKLVAGVDEVGRGAFAGPVVAAAVILPKIFPQMHEINDSKLLSSQKRAKLSEIIVSHALHFSISEIPVRVINRFGIGKATQCALRIAVRRLAMQPDFMLVDGFSIKHLNRKKQKAIIKGDRISISIAAASIIAKVYRDRKMVMLSEKFKEYNFRQNKGYGTLEHRTLLKKHGFCPIHRTSFDLSAYEKTA